MNKKLLFSRSLLMMSRFKLRTFFMSIGVTVGVATLVLSRSLGSGAEQVMIERINRMFGPSSIMITAGGAHRGSQEGPVSTFKIADLEAIEARVQQVAAWDPMLVVGGRELRYKDTNRQVTIEGHSDRAEEVWNRGVIDGRLLTAADLASAARVAVIGTRLTETLFGDQSPIGEKILIDSVPFRVVGVLESIGIDPHGTDRDEDIHIPTTTVMRRFLNVDYISSAKVIARDPEKVEETADQIKQILRERHGIAAGEPDDFAVFTPKIVALMVARTNRVLKVFLPTAAGVGLLVAAIVISSIMLIAVRERIGEVGLRKAVGATEKQISLQFLVEAVGVTVASGLAGLFLGVAVATWVAQRMQLPVVITAESMALGFAAALVVGIVSGLLPARRAARLDPVEALR
jgi:putative ABC transport system permease protein